MWRLDRRTNRSMLLDRKLSCVRVYINTPTARTPMVISAIHVSSLLFSAIQSPIHELWRR